MSEPPAVPRQEGFGRAASHKGREETSSIPTEEKKQMENSGAAASVRGAESGEHEPSNNDPATVPRGGA